MRSILQLSRTEFIPHMLPQKSRRRVLIACFRQPEPNEVPMIRHQHVGRTRPPISCARMQQDLAKTSVESLIEPTCSAVFNRMRPKHRRASLIPLARQPRQSRFSFERHSPSRFSRSGPPRKPTLQPTLQPDTPTSAPFLVARLVRGGTEPPHHPSLPFPSLPDPSPFPSLTEQAAGQTTRRRRPVRDGALRKHPRAQPSVRRAHGASWRTRLCPTAVRQQFI